MLEASVFFFLDQDNKRSLETPLKTVYQNRVTIRLLLIRGGEGDSRLY